MGFTRSDVRSVNPINTQLVQAIKQSTQAYVASKVSKEIPTQGESSGTYFVLGAATFTGNGNVEPAGAHGKRAIGGEFTRLGRKTISTGTFSTEEYGFEMPLDRTLLRRNQVPVDLPGLYNTILTHEVLRAHELRVSSVVTATASITNNDTLSGTSQWSDFVNSDPIDDIELGITSIYDSTAFDPATMELCALTNRAVWHKLRWHPALQAQMGANRGQRLSHQDFAGLFDLDELIVANAYRNTAKANQTVANSNIWGDDFLLFVRPRASSIEAVTFHATFTSQGLQADNYEEPQTTSDVYRVTEDVDEVLVQATAGYLIKDCLA